MPDPGLMDAALLLLQCLLAAAALGLMVALRRLRRQERRHQAAIRSLQDDLTALCDGAVGVGDHLSRVEQHLRRLAERQDQVDMYDPSLQAFDIAVQMVQGGAPVDEIMAKCGLVRSEAELLITLHRRGRLQVDHAA